MCAEDGPVGLWKDLYWDDAIWAARYIVVSPEDDSYGVLLPMHGIFRVDHVEKTAYLRLTKERFASLPPQDADPPVSRQREVALFELLGWVPYWESAAVAVEETLDVPVTQTLTEPSSGDPHLRSCGAIRRFSAQARDGPLADITDLIVGMEDWAIRFLHLSVHKTIGRHETLLNPSYVESIHDGQGRIALDIDGTELLTAPTFDPDALITPEIEKGIFEHFGSR